MIQRLATLHKHVGRILLVGLDADVHMLHAEALGQQGSALDDLLGPLDVYKRQSLIRNARS